MICSDASLLRAWSVSSMRSRNVPPIARAAAQLYIAVRAPPRCSGPVGDGAKRRRGEGLIIGVLSPPRCGVLEPRRIADRAGPAKQSRAVALRQSADQVEP